MAQEDEVRTDHEAMRRLILNRFEDDVLVREEIENWLDQVSAPGEWAPCDCAEYRFCYCFCKDCEDCDQPKDFGPGDNPKSGEEVLEIEIVPGMKILASVVADGKSGKKKQRRRRRR